MKQPDYYLWSDTVAHCFEIVSLLHDFGETFERKRKEIITR